jgi:TDG/mug DNA glycosylase family protein
VSHRISEWWLGSEIETLEDLLRPDLAAVCVGINPAPRSVAAGHYYQGRLGQVFFRRLRRCGLLADQPGWEDDLAFASGVGFTDIVKRPTSKATEIRPEEFAYGKPLLEAKLQAASPRLLIFSFKQAAEALLGTFAGNGFVGKQFAGATVFVMPGPYANAADVRARLDELAQQLS